MAEAWDVNVAEVLRVEGSRNARESPGAGEPERTGLRCPAVACPRAGQATSTRR